MNVKKYKEKSDSYFVITREEMGPFVSRTAEKIIEFGCGNGAFGKFIKSKINCFYEGVEPMSEFAELAKINLDKINCTTVEYFIENIKINGSNHKYDVIVFNDVLEHLIDPYEVIKNIKVILNFNGTVVASIPNFLNYNSVIDIFRTKDFKYTDGGILDRTHFHFFTKKSIIRMFEEAGYQIVKIEGINQTVNSIKFKLLNFISFGHFEEYKYLQYAIVVKLK